MVGGRLTNLTLQLDGTLDFGGCVPSDSAFCRLSFHDYPGFSFDEKKADTPPMIQFTGMKNLVVRQPPFAFLIGAPKVCRQPYVRGVAG